MKADADADFVKADMDVDYMRVDKHADKDFEKADRDDMMADVDIVIVLVAIVA